MVNVHDFTHMPWWSTIILTTIVARTLTTLPLSIYQQSILAKVENISQEMPAIAEELKKETNMAVRKFKWNEQQAKMMYSRSMKIQWNNLIIRENCHPAKSFVLLLIQIPLWICQSYAIRNLVYGMPDPTTFEAQSIMAELALGGFLWIPNLTDIDHSFIMPVAFGVLNLTIIEVSLLADCF
jgi:mitochondrial inner membrane protein COX18